MIWLLLLYNVVNVYTDIRWRKTKNFWHLLFFLASFLLLLINGPPLWSMEMLQLLFVAIIVWLLVGLFFETFRLFSPGDTKMLIVNASWVSFLTYSASGWNSLVQTLLQFFGLILLTFLVGSISLTIRQFGWKATFASLYLRQTLKKANGHNLSMPGAVPISLAVFITVFTIW